MDRYLLWTADLKNKCILFWMLARFQLSSQDMLLRDRSSYSNFHTPSLPFLHQEVPHALLDGSFSFTFSFKISVFCFLIFQKKKKKYKTENPLKLPMCFLAVKVREGNHGELIKVIPMFDFQVLNAEWQLHRKVTFEALFRSLCPIAGFK